MKSSCLKTAGSAWELIALYLFPLLVSAQLISLKTVPLATGDQFLIFPSEYLAMGGVSIAVEDSLLDPFLNPAKGAYLSGERLVASPVYYRVSQGDGSARTVPVGALYGSERRFGGMILAVQELQAASRRTWWGWRQQETLSDRSSKNIFAFGILGKTLPRWSLTLGASVFWADLSALDGVDLLYTSSLGIEQTGQMLDYRAGVLKKFGSGALAELLVLLNRLNMTHNVRYGNWRETWIEKNLDRTDTWGLYARYVVPPGRSRWRRGVMFTANLKTHPKIPNYEIMNIPRDPGDSWAYNVGVGLSRRQRNSTIGIDLVYEPIWSNTWAEADTVIETASGGTLLPGDKTVVNDFEFSNYHLRLGIAHHEKRYGFLLGLILRSIQYDLHQQDRIEETQRDQREDWMEWTPSWGITLKFPELHVRYVRRWTTGTGRPGVRRDGRGAIFNGLGAGGDFILAPSGSLTLREASVVTHQISITVPLKD